MLSGSSAGFRSLGCSHLDARLARHCCACASVPSAAYRYVCRLLVSGQSSPVSRNASDYPCENCRRLNHSHLDINGTRQLSGLSQSELCMWNGSPVFASNVFMYTGDMRLQTYRIIFRRPLKLEEATRISSRQCIAKIRATSGGP